MAYQFDEPWRRVRPGGAGGSWGATGGLSPEFFSPPVQYEYATPPIQPAPLPAVPGPGDPGYVPPGGGQPPEGPDAGFESLLDEDEDDFERGSAGRWGDEDKWGSPDSLSQRIGDSVRGFLGASTGAPQTGVPQLYNENNYPVWMPGGVLAAGVTNLRDMARWNKFHPNDQQGILSSLFGQGPWENLKTIDDSETLPWINTAAYNRADARWAEDQTDLDRFGLPLSTALPPSIQPPSAPAVPPSFFTSEALNQMVGPPRGAVMPDGFWGGIPASELTPAQRAREAEAQLAADRAREEEEEEERMREYRDAAQAEARQAEEEIDRFRFG